MSSRTTRRHRLRWTRSGRRRQQPVAGGSSVQRQVVDLTCEEHNYNEQFVDLTDFDGSPVIIPDTPTSRATAGNDETNSENLLTPYLVSDGSVSDDDLPPVPFKISATPRTTRPVNSAQSNSGTANSSPAAQCPVCLDSLSEVKAAGRQVMATTCGHVFCEGCIKGVLNGNFMDRKCPTCRKKLTTRSVHPLFI